MRPYKILIFVMFLLSVNIYGAEMGNGLSFKSYEVTPDKRTSLLIPSSDCSLGLSGSVSLSFDVRIDDRKDKFGYVCRVLVDDDRVFDLILSTSAENGYIIGLASSDDRLYPLPFEGNDINRWNNIHISMSLKESMLKVSVNGVDMSVPLADVRAHKLQFAFGKNEIEEFRTSDVAPMHLRDMVLKRDGRVIRKWPLMSENEIHNDGMIQVSDADWLTDRNRKWREIKHIHFDSRVFPVIDAASSGVFFVSGSHVDFLDVNSGDYREYVSGSSIANIGKLTNDFMVFPDTGELMYVDMDGDNVIVSRFDKEKCRWCPEIKRNRFSTKLHHNTFLNPIDSSVVRMFGYGFHKYSNELCVWKKGEDVVYKDTLSGVFPRYLSSVGLCDSVAYIYGGKGNRKGAQVYGTKIYNDLYEFDLRNYTFRKLWSLEADDQEVAASSIVVDSDDTFVGLFYNPNVYNTSVRLRRYSICDGSYEEIGDEIPYSFIDVSSNVCLFYDKISERYIAVLSGIHEEGQYYASVYSINAPVSTEEVSYTAKAWPWWILYILVALAFGVIIFIVVIRIRRREDKGTGQEVTQEIRPTETGIHLTGKFRCINSKGEDVTNNFTPLMQQLLSAIILYTVKDNGISNVLLKDILWSDKSENSYYNNRGVNIRKLRLALSEVGDIELIPSNGFWTFKGDIDICDYVRYMSFLGRFDPLQAKPDDIKRLLSIASKGTLLTDFRTEWLDGFKEAYSDIIIRHLTDLMNRKDVSDESLIQIADALLVFDSLNEDAILCKCRTLIRLRRHGLAQGVYKKFTHEYQSLMGEDYLKTFNEFIK